MLVSTSGPAPSCRPTNGAAYEGEGRRNHVWGYDFVEAQTHEGRKLRLTTPIDGFTRKCLAIRVARRINSFGVTEALADVMLARGVPDHLWTDGSEMTPMRKCV